MTITLTFLSFFIGPLIIQFWGTSRRLLHFLDGLLLISFISLTGFHLLPYYFDLGGWPILLFLVAGYWLPRLSEKFFERDHSAGTTDKAALWLGLVGLSIHAALEGAGMGSDSGTTFLAWTIILHRVPFGALVWWVSRPLYGRKIALLQLFLLAAASGAGLGLGGVLEKALERPETSWLQALVLGSLVHVFLHRGKVSVFEKLLDQEGEDKPASGRRLTWLSGLGGLTGLLFFLTLTWLEEGRSVPGITGQLPPAGERFLQLFLASAPALLLGYTLGGLLETFLPARYIQWLRPGRRLWQSFKGMAVGLPVPVCSCGVVPLYQSLVKKRVPMAAGIAFLIATPELGADAILLSLPLLGEKYTGMRLAGAALTALLAAWLVSRLAGRFASEEMEPEPRENPPAISPPFWFKVKKGLAYGFGDILEHTAPWILLGLFVAALAEPVLAGGFAARGWSAGLEVVFFALLGIPIYVCATGATPLVAVMLWSGVSPGAGLAFLLTGPATNLTTFGLLASLHGKRVAWIFSASVIGLALTTGLLVNSLVDMFSGPDQTGNEWLGLPAASGNQFLENPGIGEIVAAVILAGLFLVSFARTGPRAFLGQLNPRGVSHHHH